MTSTTGRFSKIAERLDLDPEIWKPAPGDKVVGIVIAVSEYTGDWGTYSTVTLETEDEQLVLVRGFHTVLKGELQRINPQHGGVLGVKYLGVPEGRSYEHYRVWYEGPTAPTAAIESPTVITVEDVVERPQGPDQDIPF